MTWKYQTGTKIDECSKNQMIKKAYSFLGFNLTIGINECQLKSNFLISFGGEKKT